jgi:hypothetical protein
MAMGLTPLMQDRLLNWFRGENLPSPPAQLHLSLHSTPLADPPSELNDVLGGRIPFAPSDLVAPRDQPGTPGSDPQRETAILRACLSLPPTAAATALSFCIWDAPTSGAPLVRGQVIGNQAITAGVPVVWLPGDLVPFSWLYLQPVEWAVA